VFKCLLAFDPSQLQQHLSVLQFSQNRTVAIITPEIFGRPKTIISASRNNFRSCIPQFRRITCRKFYHSRYIPYSARCIYLPWSLVEYHQRFHTSTRNIIREKEYTFVFWLQPRTSHDKTKPDVAVALLNQHC
jgi:hypothetical protein